MFLKGKIKLSFIIVLATFLVSHYSVTAQSSAIEGTIIDLVTRVSLPSANIILKGTSIGATSNNEGEFVIRNIPPGAYTVKTSYVGYKANEFKIILRANSTFRTVIKLNPASIREKTVRITSQASGQNQAINKQLISDQIQNVVSSASIEELPDANAAEAVGRLPGVTVIPEGGEGAELVIRGFSPQYNQITIEGVQLPANVIAFDENSQSTKVGDRATNLSIISSSTIGGIEVIKAITPDMDAAVLGGVVNFNMRKAIVDSSGSPSFEFLMQGGYNGLKNTYNDYKFVGTYQQRFFSQKLGVLLQGNIERRNGSTDSMRANYSLNDKSHGTEGIPDLISINLKDQLNIIDKKNLEAVLDYKYSTGAISFMNLFTTTSSNPVLRSEAINSMRISDPNTITYSALQSKIKLNMITDLLSVNQQILLFNLDLKLSHTYSENNAPEELYSSFYQGDAGLSGSRDLSKVTPRTFMFFAKPNENISTFNGIDVSSNSLRDRLLTSSIDLHSDYRITDMLTAKIKFGGSYQYRFRSFDRNYNGRDVSSVEGAIMVEKITKLYPGLQTYGNILTLKGFIDKSYSFGNFLSQYYMTHPIDVNFIHAIYDMYKPTTVLENDKYNSSIYDYNGTERKSAEYVMAKFKFGNLVTFIPGLRYQNLTTSYLGYRTIHIDKYILYSDTTVTRSNGYWLPMVHMICKPLSWLQVHFAYTNTINYPDFSIIRPGYTLYQNSTIYYNNYNLKPATSENYDLVISFFDNKIGILSINGFKKRIKDLVFTTTTYISDLSQYMELPHYPNKTYTFNTYINNTLPVDDWGIEAEWRTHFWYLPEPFSWLVFNVNYTHTFTKAYYPQKVYHTSYNVDGSYNLSVSDTFYQAPLLNTPGDVINSSVGIDHKGFSSRLSFLYTNNIFERADFWMQNRNISGKSIRWDLSVRQRLPWFGTQIFLDLNNITGEDNVSINQKTMFPASVYHYGMSAELGLRVKFWQTE